MTQRIASSHLRVDVGGAPAIDGSTFSSTGEHVLVLGAARALFETAAGLRTVAHGSLLIDGMSPTQAIRARTAASAPLDPPLPGSWTVLQYATWSARLAGHGRSEAFDLAADAIGRMQLTTTAITKLAAAPPPVRRAVTIAAAIATGAKVLLIDDPLVGLPPEASVSLARAVARATGDRSTVFFAPRVRLDSPIALTADEVIVVDGSGVSAQGAPTEIAAAERTLALRVYGQVDALVHAIEARGGRAFPALGALPPVHVRVELGSLSAREVLLLALESDAVVVELRPFARAFA